MLSSPELQYWVSSFLTILTLADSCKWSMYIRYHFRFESSKTKALWPSFGILRSMKYRTFELLSCFLSISKYYNVWGGSFKHLSCYHYPDILGNMMYILIEYRLGFIDNCAACRGYKYKEESITVLPVSWFHLRR